MTTLKAQLEGLNQALLGLDIRSQEVENIRQSLLQANQQALSMPLLNGKLEQINFDQIEKQLNTIQMDMVKLAAMIMAGDEKLDSKLILNFLFSNKKPPKGGFSISNRVLLSAVLILRIVSSCAAVSAKAANAAAESKSLFWFASNCSAFLRASKIAASSKLSARIAVSARTVTT